MGRDRQHGGGDTEGSREGVGSGAGRFAGGGILLGEENRFGRHASIEMSGASGHKPPDVGRMRGKNGVGKRLEAEEPGLEDFLCVRRGFGLRCGAEDGDVKNRLRPNAHRAKDLDISHREREFLA